MPVENLINSFSKAAEEGDVTACCIYCYLELDNGIKEMENAMTKFEQSTDAQYIKDGAVLSFSNCQLVCLSLLNIY